ncbi:hypothetical protein A2U01_0108569, partial [Trifolium medium]|nr:hypothetical protein [Trifolium medium]
HQTQMDSINEHLSSLQMEFRKRLGPGGQDCGDGHARGDRLAQ